MHKKNIFFCVILLMCCSVMAQNTAPVFTSSQKPIIVSQHNPVFIITLPSNPTTGFSWKLFSYDKNLVTLLHHKYAAPENKKLLGAPGYEVWVFQANKMKDAVNQVGHIHMTYARPWTTTGATTVSFVVIVKK